MSGAGAPPWWWLEADLCRALGLGAHAERTALGVVFGSPDAPLRIELVSSSHDAPVKAGAVSLRVWGQAEHPRARRLAAAVAHLLSTRGGSAFAPDDAQPWLAVAPDASAQATVVDVPSVCDRACVFCHVSQRPPATRSPRGVDAAVVAAIEASRGPILFSGDDALAHPRIVELVALARSRGLRVSLIGPPREGRTAALAPALARAGLSRYVTGVFGPDGATHDRIAGRPGAFSALGEAARAMAAAGVAVELVTPLVRPVLPVLGPTIVTGRALVGREPALLAYAPDSMVGTAFDAMVPRWEDLRIALAAIERDAARADGLPLCVLPPSWRATAPARLDRSDGDLGSIYPQAACGACDERSRCPGIATTVERAVGGAGLVALRAGG